MGRVSPAILAVVFGVVGWLMAATARAELGVGVGLGSVRVQETLDPDGVYKTPICR